MITIKTVYADVIGFITVSVLLVAVWLFMERVKTVSSLVYLYKKPIYLAIVITTIIPLYIISRNHSSALASIIGKAVTGRGVNSTALKPLKNAVGIDNRMVMPSGSNNYKKKHLSNYDTSSTKYQTLEQGDRVISDVLDTNYIYGSPEDRKSQFIFKGEVCRNQSFVPENNVRVKWSLIQNKSPRFCETPKCTESTTKTVYGNMNTNSSDFYKNNCDTPYKKIINTSVNNDSFIGEWKEVTTVKQAHEMCEAEQRAGGFVYHTGDTIYARLVNKEIYTRKDILESQDNTYTTYVKPPISSIVHKNDLLKTTAYPSKCVIDGVTVPGWKKQEGRLKYVGVDKLTPDNDKQCFAPLGQRCCNATKDGVCNANFTGYNREGVKNWMKYCGIEEEKTTVKGPKTLALRDISVPTKCPSGYSGPNSNNECTKSSTSECGLTCAKNICESDGGTWIPKDYSRNPYTCSPITQSTRNPKHYNSLHKCTGWNCTTVNDTCGSGNSIDYVCKNIARGGCSTPPCWWSSNKTHFDSTSKCSGWKCNNVGDTCGNGSSVRYICKNQQNHNCTNPPCWVGV